LVPIFDLAQANEELANMETESYFPCCGKSICSGCLHSFRESGNNEKCPFCNTDRGKTEEEEVGELMRRVEANDAASINLLGNSYENGLLGLQQDQTRAIELYVRAADLGFNKAHCNLGNVYHEGGDLKKAKFHYEAAAMAGHEDTRNNLGYIEFESRNMERAMKHWKIGASAGGYTAMHHLRICFKNATIHRIKFGSLQQFLCRI
jgi:TPR repeat protein